MNQAEIQNAIDISFAGAHYPGDANIVQPTNLEAANVLDFFRGKRREEITLTSLRTGYIGDASACLEYMTPEAINYYLPAYLSISLQHYYEADMISLGLIYMLVDVSKRLDRPLTHAIERFTPMQKECIALFLEYISDEYESKEATNYAAIALDLYWRDFLIKNTE